MNTITHFASGVLTAAMTTLGSTVPANRKFVVKAFTISNDTGGAVALRLQVTFTTGGTARLLVPSRSVADNDTDLVPELINQVIDAGGFIEALGDGLVFAIAGVAVNA